MTNEYQLLSQQVESNVHTLDSSYETASAKTRDLIGFFICGLLNNYGYVVMLSAAEDMLKDSDVHLSPAVVLLADILPCFCIQLTAPFFIHLFPYWLRIITIVSLAVLSFLIPALCTPVYIKLIGVMFASFSSGFGEITFLSYSSFYHKNTVSTFSSGTGGAGILGSMSYLILREFLHFTSKQTLIVCSWLPVGMAIGFFAILSKPATPNPMTIEPDFDDESIQAPDSDKANPLTFSEKSRLLVQLLPYTIPLFIVYFGEYLINQGVTPVLDYPHSMFNKKEYIYYQALYQIGVFISRSSVNFVPLRNLWLPAVFQAINAIFLSIAAVFGFIPYIWIVFGIIIWEGLLGGSIYVNAFYLISQRFEGKEKEFCLGATSMSYGLSISISAGVGIIWTPFLKYLQKRV